MCRVAGATPWALHTGPRSPYITAPSSRMFRWLVPISTPSPGTAAVKFTPSALRTKSAAVSIGLVAVVSQVGDLLTAVR